VIIYADSSALAKLLIQEDGSDAIGALVAAADGLVTVSISRVETFAALAAAHRDGRLDDASHAHVKSEAVNLFGGIGLVDINSALVDRACSLAEQYSLRAYDSVQLSALLTCGPDDLTFACFDGPLTAAAIAEGFAVFPPEGSGEGQHLIQN